jgi:hypothetical protein
LSAGRTAISPLLAIMLALPRCFRHYGGKIAVSGAVVHLGRQER